MYAFAIKILLQQHFSHIFVFHLRNEKLSLVCLKILSIAYYYPNERTNRFQKMHTDNQC